MNEEEPGLKAGFLASRWSMADETVGHVLAPAPARRRSSRRPLSAAVLLFRLVTFWLPILPGWIALVNLQRTGRLQI